MDCKLQNALWWIFFLMFAYFQSATAFTLVFSALVSRMTRRMAEWRLEKGSSLKTLESLNGSTTLINTVATQIQLRDFGIGSISLILLWCVSPIGSQSPLHILSTAKTTTSTPQTVQQVPINSTSVLDGADDAETYAPYFTSLYTTSLLSAGAFRYSTVDPWRNLKIPSFDALDSPANSSGWKSVPTDQNITFAALTGVPIGGLNETGNVTAVLESTYFSLHLLNKTGDLHFNGSGLVVNLTVSENFVPWNQSQSTTYNATTDSETAIVTFTPANSTFKANYLWTQDYYESEILCVVQGASINERDCSVQAMRPLRPSTPPEINFIVAYNAQLQWSGLLANKNFSLSEAYIRYPESLLEANLSSSFTASPSMEDLQTRLQQLLNTMFLSTFDPLGSLTGVPSSPVQINGTRVNFNPGSIYVINHAWMAVYFVATSILAITTILTAALTAMSSNPDILGFISTFVWHSSAFGLPQSGTYRGGDEKTRSIKSLKIRLGDASHMKEIGHLSVGSIHDVVEVKAGRLFS